MPGFRALGLGFAFAFVLDGAAIGQSAAPEPTIVKIDAGSIRGVTARGVISFKGIPYAAPPVGNLRWRAPQPAKRWRGMRDADQVRPGMHADRQCAEVGGLSYAQCLATGGRDGSAAGDGVDLRWRPRAWPNLALSGRRPGGAGRRRRQHELSDGPARLLRAPGLASRDAEGVARQLWLHGPARRAAMGPAQHRGVRRRSKGGDHLR